MTTISAKIIADSIGEYSPRLTTFELKYPRFIHAEFMTHRVFSRNAASSRAIPVAKQIAAIRDDPAMPLHWGANQKGMQATQECDEPVFLGWLSSGALTTDDPDDEVIVHQFSRESAWQRTMEISLRAAEAFAAAGYHKQIVNRLIEPYSHISVCVTATEWSNFLALRDHEAAEPHIRILAQKIKEAFAASKTEYLFKGEWHLPYVTKEERREIRNYELLKPLSIARCASLSYKTVDGEPMTIERAMQLSEKLLSSAPLHASPAEHQATPDSWITNNIECPSHWQNPELHGNLVGWQQLRKSLPGESQ